MKKAVLIALAVVVVAAAGLAALFAVAMAGNQAIEDGAVINGFAHTVKDGYVAAYWLDVGDGSLALVDAGSSADGAAIVGSLVQAGRQASAVKAILLTHGDADHIGGCGAFPGAEVWALQAEVDLIEGRTRRGLTHNDGTVKVTRALADGERATIGSLSVETFAVPGHTLGSAAFLINGILFLGDSADAGTDGALMPGNRLFTSDPETNRASLKKLAERLAPRAAEVEALAFGHSGALVGLEPLLAWARRPE